MGPPPHHFTAPKIMVFRPTLEEMKDFPAFISHMESKGAHKAGIAKIIPPKEFVAAYDYEKANTITIPAPIQQEVMGHQGIYTQYNIQKKPLTFQEFRKLANSSRYATPPHFDYDDLERKYWKNITYNPPIYAADISGSLYSKGCDIWNVNRLNTLLDVIEEEQGVKIEGVNTAYLYFGMWKTTFAWHTEDMDLYSINYLHFGAPKSWYGIPPEHAKRLERLAAGFFPQSFQICPNFLRHKMTLISPQILRKYSIPYDKITQETGEFMVTFPYGYHAGYNHGFNCAESTNFASMRWIDFGKRAKCCSCQRDSVKINMDPFVRIFQPDRYEAWKQGKDVVFVEDIDKPSSHGGGMQSHAQAAVENHGPGKESEIPLKTRRQPLHKKDGRRVKAGTTSQRKRTHKPENEEEETISVVTQNPAIVSVVKVELGSSEAIRLALGHSHAPEKSSDVTTTEEPKRELNADEPATKIPRLESPSATESSATDDSTRNVKKKKDKLKKRDLKTKNRHNKRESRLDVHNTEANGEPSKSTGEPSKSTGEPSKSTGEPSKSTGEPSKSTGEPSKSTGEPSKSTGEPSKSTGEPSKSTGEPSQKSSRASRKSKGKEISKDKRVKKALLQKSREKTVIPKQYHSDSELSVSNVNDGLLKPKTNTSQPKSPKTGLLLEKEKAKKRRKLTAQKAASQKLGDGVKRDHEYSSSADNAEDPLSREKVKRTKTKSDKLVKRSSQMKSDKHPAKPVANQTDDVSVKTAKSAEGKETKLETQHCLNAVATEKIATEKMSSRRKASTSTNGQTARNSKPRGNAKHDFTAQEFATMKSWARSMNGLWVTQPNSYEMELAYNLSIADQRPGCCICMLFFNEKIDGNKWDTKEQNGSETNGSCVDQRTVVLTPEMSFAATSEDQAPECMNDNLTSEGCSKLLNCSQCKIAVHASCYGELSVTSETWKCRRCQNQDYLAECCLCNLRGGALKRTTNGRWAHIICAMAIPEVLFENITAREPINIDKISPARLKLKCFFCRPFIKMGNKFGGLIQCSVGRCALAFHVTCAQAAGVVMEPCDWPYAVYATCLRHPYSDKMGDDPREYPLKNVSVGETVTAKHKNSRYYKSEVTGDYQQDLYHVKFDDGSYSDNLFPHDIESRDCRHDGPPPEGAQVTVRWTDGLLYKGTFVRNYSVKMYDVEFEDGSMSRVKREDVYCQDESLPKKVLTKLSTASDMRHENFLYSEVVTERHRHVYSLYASSASEAEEKACSTKRNEANEVTGDSAKIVSTTEHTGKTADNCSLPKDMNHVEPREITVDLDKIPSTTTNVRQATDGSTLPHAVEYSTGNVEQPSHMHEPDFDSYNS